MYLYIKKNDNYFVISYRTDHRTNGPIGPVLYQFSPKSVLGPDCGPVVQTGLFNIPSDKLYYFCLPLNYLPVPALKPT